MLQFGRFPGSASPSGKSEACIGDLFNFDFKDVGAAVVGRNVVWLWEGYIMAKFLKVNIWRAAREACSALGPRKSTENLDRVGRLQDLPDAN
jgi:hypothetical protein